MPRTRTRKNIQGRTLQYVDWHLQVVQLADAEDMPDHLRDLATEPMMADAWEKGETPEHFLRTLRDLA